MAQHPLKDGLHPSTITTSSPLHQFSVSPTNSNNNLRPHPPGVRPGTDYTPNVGTTPDPLSDIPESILNFFLEGNNSSKIDLDIPHLRPVFRDGLFSVFLTLFVILVMVSCIANSATLLLIIKQKLYKESITLCLANMMGVHSLQACLVLPLCLYTRLVQNWVLGETLCYVLPVITDLPSHLCMLTLFTANLIRYGKLLFPSHSRPTPALLLPLCWLVSLLLVLPYLPHIQWRLLAAPGPRVVGGQLCVSQEEDFPQARMVRGTFLLLLSVPVVTSLYLLCRVWWVLSTMERLGTTVTTTTAVTSDSREQLDTRDSTGQLSSTDTVHSGDNNNDDSVKLTNTARGQIISVEDRDFITQEKKTQMLLFSCLTVHVICILPFNIFKLILPSLKQSISPTTVDLVYIMLLWVSFLPCTSIPALYVLWTTGTSQTDTQASTHNIFDKINSKKAIAEKEHQRRMSNMRMEELNRRHSTLGSPGSPLKSPQGSLVSHRSPQAQSKAGEQNSLMVAVQQRRASIISISPDNLLDVTTHSRSASVRSTHSHKHLQPQGQQNTPTIMLDNREQDPVPGRRKSYVPTHYGRNSSFRYREARYRYSGGWG